VHVRQSDEILVSVRMHLPVRETVDEAQWCSVSFEELDERHNLGDHKSRSITMILLCSICLDECVIFPLAILACWFIMMMIRPF
jgi:hypothetical protein